MNGLQILTIGIFIILAGLVILNKFKEEKRVGVVFVGIGFLFVLWGFFIHLGS